MILSNNIPFYAQTCDYEVKVVFARDLDCAQNGSITLELVGEGIEEMTPISYRAYLKGDESVGTGWVSNNVLGGDLPEGTYICQASAFCHSTGVPIIKTVEEEVVLTRKRDYVTPTLGVSIQRKPLTCTSTGKISVTPRATSLNDRDWNIKVGNRYVLTIINAPGDYTGPTVLMDTTYLEASGSSTKPVEFEGFPAGTYTLQFRDACGTYTYANFTLNALADIQSSSFFYNTTVTVNCNGVVTFPGLYPGYDYTYYVQNAPNYYEYAFYYRETDDPALIPDNQWKALPYTTPLTYNTGRSLNELRENKALIPAIAVRAKKDIGCSGMNTINPSANTNWTFTNPTISITSNNSSSWSSDSTQYTIKFNPYTGSNAGAVCYPYKWVITKETDGTILAQSTADVTDGTAQTSTISGVVPGDRCRLTFTDADGFEFYVVFTIFAYPYVTPPVTPKPPSWNVTGGFEAKPRTVGECVQNDSLRGYLLLTYNPGDDGTGLSEGGLIGLQIDFYEPMTAADMLVPKWKSITITDTLVHSLKIYPWADDIYSGDYNIGWNQIRYYYSSVYFGYTKPNNAIQTVFSFRKKLMYSRYEIEYIAEPEVEYTYRCGITYGRLISTGIRYTQVNESGSSSATIGSTTTTTNNSSGSYRLTYDAQGFGNTATYTWSTNGTLQFYKGGTYSSEIAMTVGNCTYKDSVDFQVPDPEYGLDYTKTIAYRCPDNTSFGYIRAVVKGGSSSAILTLHAEEDEATNFANPIDTANAQGVFTKWAGKSDANSFVVLINDSAGCKIKMSQPIPIYDLSSETIGWVDGGPRQCIGDSIRFYALTLADEEDIKDEEKKIYEWIFPVTGDTIYKQNPVIYADRLELSGKVYLTVKVEGCNGALVRDTIDLYIAGPKMYWRHDADNADWHDADNWLVIDDNGDPVVSKSIPAPCTTVHVPGYSKTFPNFDFGETSRQTQDGITIGVPACDTIIYHYGSETVYPHYLQYNRAKVRYNFGHYGNDSYPIGTGNSAAVLPNYNMEEDYPAIAQTGITGVPVIERARWYILSSPLKHTLTGDFNLGGYPHMYERLYNTYHPGTGYPARDNFTRTFNTLALPLENTGHAFALMAADYYNSLGWKDHANLEKLKGIIELPYYLEDGYDLYGLHLQKYEGSASKLWYYQADEEGLPVLEKHDVYSRDYQGYRFVFENERDEVDIETLPDNSKIAVYRMPLDHLYDGSQEKRIMIGNPLMCHLDFDALYAANDDMLENNYWIVDNNVFHTYRSGFQGSGEIYDSSLKRAIPPLQGFIVQLKDNYPRNYLTLPLEGSTSVVYTGADRVSPRSVGQGRKGYVSIYGMTPNGSDSLRIRSKVYFNYDMSDIPKLVFPEGLDKKAETFIVGSDGYLYSERMENDYPDMVKFGLESTYTSDIVFYVQSFGNLLESVILYDRETNARLDVTDGGYYTFRHRADRVESGFEGLDTERFELLMEYDRSELESIGTPNLYVQVTADRERLKVISHEMMSSIVITDMSGLRVFGAGNINSDIYESPAGFNPGLYIVKIKYSNGSVSTHKISVK